MDPQQVEKVMQEFSLAWVIDSHPKGEEFLAYQTVPQPWSALIQSDWALAG